MFQDPSIEAVAPQYPPPPQPPQYNSSFHQDPSTSVHVTVPPPAYPQFNNNPMSQVQPAYPTQAQVQLPNLTQEPPYPTQPQPAAYLTQVQSLYPTQPPMTIIQQFPPNGDPQCVEPQKEEQQNRNFATVNRSAKDPYNFLALSIINLIITAIIPCCWPLLFLTVPALLLSITSKEQSNKGKWEDARGSGYWALGLNIAAIVFMVIGFITVTVRLATL